MKIIPGGRRIVVKTMEALGLTEEEDLENKLMKLSQENLESLYRSSNFKIGSAMTGVMINATMMLIFPSNVVGTAISIRQLGVAIRTRRKAEAAAKQRHGLDLRDGPDGVGKRHYVVGAAFKASVWMVCLSQDDVVEVAGQLGWNLVAPRTGGEYLFQQRADHFFHSTAMESVQRVTEALGPGDEILSRLGFKNNPTWEILVTRGASMCAVALASMAIGLGMEANLAILAADAGAEQAHERASRSNVRNGKARPVPSCE